MVETVTIGVKANTAAQNGTALQNAMAAARTQAKVIRCRGGNYGAFACTANITDFPVTIMADDRNDPPIALSFAVASTSQTGPLNTTTGSRASTVKNFIVNGFHFISPKVSRVERPDGTFYNFRDDPDGQGYGWHMTPEIDGFQGYGSDGGFINGIILGNGASDIEIRNCLFNGYTQCINVTGSNRVAIRFNRFEKWHEDCIFDDGADNITIEYNYWAQAKCLSLADAYYGFGWGNPTKPPRPRPTSENLPSKEPPHSDMSQISGTNTNYVFQYNEQYDSTGRAHALLSKIANGGSNGTRVIDPSDFHVGTKVINNYAKSSHGNGWWFSHDKNLIVDRNKLMWSGTEDIPSIGFNVRDPSTRGHDHVNTTVTNNVACRIYPKPGTSIGDDGIPSDWTYSNNTVTGDNTTGENTLPPGWVEFRRGRTATGVPFAGQYGDPNEGGVVTTVPGLTAAQVAFSALIPGPSLPASDARRTFSINVLTGSPARDCYEMQWSSDADATLRPMVQMADSGSNQVWRAASNDSGHLRLPNGSFTNVHLYYRSTNGGILSDASVYTFSQTVPYVGEPDPTPVKIGNLALTKRLITASGEYYQLRTARGIRWTRML